MTKTIITVVSGFLGAGKTTLVKELLQRNVFGSEPILIENDYGALNIDSLLMKETGIVVEEIDSGCICCSLTGRFKEGVEQVLNTYRPEHLIIEPSGVGKLSKILQQLDEIDTPKDLEVKRTVAITVVDASRFDHNVQYVDEYFWDQVTHSNVVLMNRAECIEQGDYDRIFETLYMRTDYAPLLSGINEENLDYLERYIHSDSVAIDRAVGTSPAKSDCGCGHHHHDHGTENDFQSWSTFVEGCFSMNTLESLGDILQDSGSIGEIMRAKGIFPGVDHQYYLFDYVPGQGTIREIGVQENGWVMVVGRSLHEDSLEHLFITER